MSKKFSPKLVWVSLKESFSGFSDHKVTKLSASLAYYTLFSLGPLLIVIIFIAGKFLGEEAVQGGIYDQMKSFIGANAAEQIQTIIKNAAISGKSGIAAIIGVITLLIGATTVFGEIQDSINSIWGVKAKPKAGIMKLVMTRLLSFGLIASLGFLLLVSLAVTAVVETIGNRLREAFPDVAVVILYIINLVITLGVTTILFAIIFKVLPDIRIKWKAIWPGAIATSILFLIGKFLISIYISKSNIGSTYGTAGSLVILIVWIYYSSMILYFGAEFTKAYALKKGVHIVPSEYAIWDDKPAIAGAKSPSETERKPQKQIQPKYGLASNEERTDERKQEKKKDKKPGFGMVAAGLLLYFLKSARNDDKVRS
ncbi:MAG TPA: YihY/virulence factor BrkB family protein [Flavisolibacter sp.]|jgi:membrane protein|nr:YihY/virulence factor BrkB family protein [Flavisolibacter sp.]